MVEPIDRNILIITNGYNPSDTSYVTDLATAITQIGSANKTLIIDGPIALTGNTTVPSNIFLKVSNKEAYITSNGYTLTINGPFECGLWQAFSGFSAGDVTFGQNAIKETHPEWFGAVGDGSTSSGAAIQATIDSLTNGGIVDLSGGKWLIDSANLNVKQGVTLQGQWKNVGEISTRDYLSLNSTLIVDSNYSIVLYEDFSAIDGMIISRKGITIPTTLAEATTHVAAFAGTAIKVGDGTSAKANDTYVGHCLIVGFQYAYYNDFNERPRVESLVGDNTNGIYMKRVYDMNHIVGCHFWPFTTAHQSWTSTGDAGWRRQGTSYHFDTDVDWGQVSESFSYGYDTGFYVTSSDNVVFMNCGVDGYKDNNTYSVGFKITGTTKNINIIGCKTSSKNYGILIDLTVNGYANVVKIIGGNIRAASTVTGVLVYLQNGSAIITGGATLFDAPIGVKTDDTAGVIQITDVIFESVTTPYSIYNLSNSILGKNQFHNSTDSVGGDRSLIDGQHSVEYRDKYSADGNAYILKVRKARGNVSSPTVVGTGEGVFDIVADTYDGSDFGDCAKIQLIGRGAHGLGSTAGAIIFSTTSVSNNTVTQRFIINETGSFYPISDNSYPFGATTNRLSKVVSVAYDIGSGIFIRTGAGSPEGVVSAKIGSLYTDMSGSTNTTLYVKTAGGGSISGWTAK